MINYVEKTTPVHESWKNRQSHKKKYKTQEKKN